MDWEKQFSKDETCKTYLFCLRGPLGLYVRDVKCRTVGRHRGNPGYARLGVTELPSQQERFFKISTTPLARYARSDGLPIVILTGYTHDRQIQRQQETGEHLLPHGHQMALLLKRWLLGTQQGTLGHAHWDYYWDEDDIEVLDSLEKRHCSVKVVIIYSHRQAGQARSHRET